MTIAEFLEARIAEDEATLDAVPAAAKQSDDFDFGGTDDYLRFTIGYGRAVAECAAKQAIIEGLEPFSILDDINAPELLSILAAVYADHPDYRQEWAL